jgi:hypothetical protein
MILNLLVLLLIAGDTWTYRHIDTPGGSGGRTGAHAKYAALDDPRQLCFELAFDTDLDELLVPYA